MAEARLQMLQAQIEPHFLFNTLAHVKRLYRIDPAAGGAMLDNLMHYLAVALPRMRDADSTLGREAALAEAYLNIQQIRMGGRLAFALDVPACCTGARAADADRSARRERDQARAQSAAAGRHRSGSVRPTTPAG